MAGMEYSEKPRILVAPLDWGLGHATRCIPLIRLLIINNCHVIIAAESKIKKLLLREFPKEDFIELKGYRIRYSGRKWKMPFTIASQVPQILNAIKEEQFWLENAAQEFGFDGIISDNRYGLYHSSIPSVFITHQLYIKTPLGSIAGNILQKLNYSYIEKFHSCWVPDLEGSYNLAGKLSHPEYHPEIPIEYINPVSRFAYKESNDENYILISLSGPEPARTSFEKIILKETGNIKNKIILVRGIPGSAEQIRVPSNIEVHDHLPANELEEKMLKASYVIARSGYSTVMDLYHLKKKSILVPTPGQPEQEYLADHLMRNNFALCIAQEKFRLKQAIDLAISFNYKLPGHVSNEPAQNAIMKFIDDVKKAKKKKQQLS